MGTKVTVSERRRSSLEHFQELKQLLQPPIKPTPKTTAHEKEQSIPRNRVDIEDHFETGVHSAFGHLDGLGGVYHSMNVN
jgi:hypothetical protein